MFSEIIANLKKLKKMKKYCPVVVMCNSLNCKQNERHGEQWLCGEALQKNKHNVAGGALLNNDFWQKPEVKSRHKFFVRSFFLHKCKNFFVATV